MQAIRALPIASDLPLLILGYDRKQARNHLLRMFKDLLCKKGIPFRLSNAFTVICNDNQVVEFHGYIEKQYLLAQNYSHVFYDHYATERIDFKAKYEKEG
jgi:hypothetical protein